jgi:hypothetical protein
MATAAIDRDFVDAIASELASGVEAAVEQWMSEFESALQDPRLTTLGRLQAIQDVVARYKYLTGKSELHGRACSQIN